MDQGRLDRFVPSKAPVPPAQPRLWPLVVTLTGLLAAMALFSFTVGRFPIPPLVALSALFGLGTDVDPMLATVLHEVRLPRIAGAMIVGASLAAAGATFQCIFRNPLVSPAVLGTSQGAAFGASLALLLRLPWAGVTAAAIGFGILATVTTAAIGRSLGAGTLVTLVLAGLIVAAVFNALVAITQYFADPLDTLPAITFWLMGSLNRIGTQDVAWVMAPAMLTGALLYALRWQINILGTDRDTARALGVSVPLMTAIAIGGAAVLTALAVSVSGIIGWVGLVVPHVARVMVGPNFHRLLPVSALIGAIYLLAMDSLARSVSTQEIPLGVVTALVGAPFFAILLGRARKQWF